MKVSNKTISIAAGIIFLWQAAAGIWSMLQMGGYFYHIARFYLVIDLYEIVVLTVMGVFALRQKKRGKLLNYLGMAYIGYVLGEIITFFQVSTLLRLAILIVAFVLSQKSNAGFIMEPKSEAAKTRAQAQMQSSIYAQQLRDGILTQGEYDQIMKNKK